MSKHIIKSLWDIYVDVKILGVVRSMIVLFAYINQLSSDVLDDMWRKKITSYFYCYFELNLIVPWLFGGFGWLNAWL